MKKYSINDANSAAIAYIASHFLESDLSLRAFCDQYCDFSHVTLRDKFNNVLNSVNETLYLLVMQRLEAKKAKSIHKDIEAQKRVKEAVYLLVAHNLTVEEIADILHSTEMTIYRDLTRRINDLDDISMETKKAVCLKLKEHRMNNIGFKGR